MPFGQGLRILRARTTWSLRTLHRLSGVPWYSIHDVEKGRRDIRATELDRLAQAFHLTPGELLGWAKVEDMYPAKGCPCQEKEAT